MNLSQWYKAQTGLNPFSPQGKREVQAIGRKLREWGLPPERVRLETHPPGWKRKPGRSSNERRAVEVGRTPACRLHHSDEVRWLVPGR